MQATVMQNGLSRVPPTENTAIVASGGEIWRRPECRRGKRRRGLRWTGGGREWMSGFVHVLRLTGLEHPRLLGVGRCGRASSTTYR